MPGIYQNNKALDAALGNYITVLRFYQEKGILPVARKDPFSAISMMDHLYWDDFHMHMNSVYYTSDKNNMFSPIELNCELFRVRMQAICTQAMKEADNYASYR